VRSLLETPQGARAFVHELLGHPFTSGARADIQALRALLAFRAQSVSRFVGAVARLINGKGLDVGLDCFSPALAWMVGQDLGTLDDHGQWLKTMSYGHTMGPAGMPFELLGLADWLVGRYGIRERDALAWLSLAAQLELPKTRAALRERGLHSSALRIESLRARKAGVRRLLPGIELVDLKGVTRLCEPQIVSDLEAFRSTGAEGLVLSWDLWHIPLGRLELVQRVWLQAAT
jgi:hypothetical protein